MISMAQLDFDAFSLVCVRTGEEYYIFKIARWNLRDGGYNI